MHGYRIYFIHDNVPPSLAKSSTHSFGLDMSIHIQRCVLPLGLLSVFCYFPVGTPKKTYGKVKVLSFNPSKEWVIRFKPITPKHDGCDLKFGNYNASKYRELVGSHRLAHL